MPEKKMEVNNTVTVEAFDLQVHCDISVAGVAGTLHGNVAPSLVINLRCHNIQDLVADRLDNLITQVGQQ